MIFWQSQPCNPKYIPKMFRNKYISIFLSILVPRFVHIFFFFFLKFLADTCPFLGPLVPLFWISGDVSSGFQSQSGFCLIRYFLRSNAQCNVHSPKIHLWCYTYRPLGGRRTAGHFPTCMCRGGTWLRFECATA